jgi:hypothetical protein
MQNSSLLTILVRFDKSHETFGEGKKIHYCQRRWVNLPKKNRNIFLKKTMTMGWILT